MKKTFMTWQNKLSHLNRYIFSGILFTGVSASALTNFIGNMTSTSVQFSFDFQGTPAFVRVFVDADRNSATGFTLNGIGADFLIENNNLYKFSGQKNSTWAWQSRGLVTQVKSLTNVKWTIARSQLNSTLALRALANTSKGDSSNILTLSSTSSGTPSTPTPTPTPTPTTPPTFVTYESHNNFLPNPERGFFLTTDCRSNPVSVSQLQAYRSQYGQTVFNCLWYLREFKNAPLNATVLEQLQTQMNNMRTAGMKMILRFAYTSTDINDAPLSVVQGHLDQLAPILRNNSDIIATVQAGIIGQWAEMSTSANYGGATGPFTETDWARRKAVIDKLLSVIPSTRMVAVRTPEFKMQPYGLTPLTDSEAFTSSARARVSHYNDCFLSSSTDWGTYRSSADKDFLKQDSKFLAMSGETCALATQNDCTNALNEMSSLHWSLLHEGYNVDVINKWKAQGCFATIKSKLGYRIHLQEAQLSASAKTSGIVSVSLKLVNSGFAAFYNPRPVQIVLRNVTTGALIRLPLKADPRRWLPGSIIQISEEITLPPSVSAGTYEMLLALPDAESSLASRPEYAVQLANTGVWEATTGLNKLKANLVVSP